LADPSGLGAPLLTGVVLDVSATLPWCFEDEATPGSIALLDQLRDAPAIVPALWHVELANALIQAEQRKRINATAIAAFLSLIANLTIETDDSLDHRTLHVLIALARQHKLTAYDATYLELASRRELPLATRDAALRRVARSTGVALSEA